MNMAIGIPSLSVQGLVERIGAHEVSPGAGSAGAVALALAAACARKAVSVSLSHAPEDAELQAAGASFDEIARLALSDAERDSEAFKAFVRRRDPAAVDRLVSEGEHVAHLIGALSDAIVRIEKKIRPNMAGDLVAARALLTAASCIQRRNEEEALQAR